MAVRVIQTAFIKKDIDFLGIHNEIISINPDRKPYKCPVSVYSANFSRLLSQVERETLRRDEKAERDRSEWVFPNRNDRSRPMYECQKLAQRIRKESRVTFRAHDFRRTAASMMAGMGIPRLVIGMILNHVESGVTKVYDRYSCDPEKRHALDAWGARIAKIVSGLELVKEGTREA
jgi:integrase